MKVVTLQVHFGGIQGVLQKEIQKQLDCEEEEGYKLISHAIVPLFSPGNFSPSSYMISMIFEEE